MRIKDFTNRAQRQTQKTKKVPFFAKPFVKSSRLTFFSQFSGDSLSATLCNVYFGHLMKSQLSRFYVNSIADDDKDGNNVGDEKAQCGNLRIFPLSRFYVKSIQSKLFEGLKNCLFQNSQDTRIHVKSCVAEKFLNFHTVEGSSFSVCSRHGRFHIHHH